MYITRGEAEPATSAEPPLEGVLRAVRELHSTTEALFDVVAERYGINRNDLRCLEIVEREGPLSPRHLAAASGLSPAAVTKVLDRLAGAGYVTRRPSTEDRRALVVAVTGRHGELRKAVWQPVATEAGEALGSLPEGELRALATTLNRLAEVNRGQTRRLSDPAEPG